jgi:zinc transport system substrate-binding protein
MIAIFGVTCPAEPPPVNTIFLLAIFPPVKSLIYSTHYTLFKFVSPRVSEIIQNEIGAKSLTLHNLEALTEENVKDQEDYLSIMRKNIDVIQTALN